MSVAERVRETYNGHHDFAAQPNLHHQLLQQAMHDLVGLGGGSGSVRILELGHVADQAHHALVELLEFLQTSVSTPIVNRMWEWNLQPAHQQEEKPSSHPSCRA